MKYNYEDYAEAFTRQDIDKCRVIGKQLLQQVIINWSTNLKIKQEITNLIQRLDTLTKKEQDWYSVLESVKFIVYSYK